MVKWLGKVGKNLRQQVQVTSLLLGAFALLAFGAAFIVATATWIGSEEVIGRITQVDSRGASSDAPGKLRSIDVSFELDDKIVTQTLTPRKLSSSYEPGDEIVLLVANDKVSIKSVEEQFGLSIFLLVTSLVMMITWAATQIRIRP